MSYSEKLLEHYDNPRNVGSLDRDDPNVGTGLVGAPSCGDVMKLQIKVSEAGIIEDAKFKTFGCLVSSARVCTPDGMRHISSMCEGDPIYAWNGVSIIVSHVKCITQSVVDYSRLVRVELEKGNPRSFLCTEDHILWSSDNRPIEAFELTGGMELLCMTERELRSLNNVGKRKWLRDANSARMRETNKRIDHSKLPQNTRGRVLNDEIKEKISSSMKERWNDTGYIKKWSQGMKSSCERRPTLLEKKFIDVFGNHDVDVEYIGDGSLWIQTSDGPRNPDFRVRGQKKAIEVYTRDMPVHMENRETCGWMVKKKKLLSEKGWDCMFIDIANVDSCVPDVQRFIHNGIKVVSVDRVTDRRQLRGVLRDGDNVMTYDLELKGDAHIFFVQRAMSHNCGSAIAASSLATEWIKGTTIDEAEDISNTQIVKELSLPPVKIHCSVLAEDAIKAAIADYRKKKVASTIEEVATA